MEPEAKSSNIKYWILTILTGLFVSVTGGLIVIYLSEKLKASSQENTESNIQSLQKPFVNAPSIESDFYIISIAAVKTEEEARKRVLNLKSLGKSANFLWIPDYYSLSSLPLYCVYIGPYTTQRDCEVATEHYKKLHPDVYGLLVSHTSPRVQINGIGKVVRK